LEEGKGEKTREKKREGEEKRSENKEGLRLIQSTQ
jgi:hypothetical protein